MRPSPRTMTLRLLVALVLTAALGPASLAQPSEYKADEVDRSLRSRGQIVKRFLQNGVGDAEEFRNYFKRYYFPAMTQPTSEGLESLGKYSNDLFKTYLDRANGADEKYLSNEALKFAVGVIRERDYHPAVRLNAFLILGRLNDDYSEEKIVPSVKANDTLCSLAKRAVERGRVPRYELTGALTGLTRHARYLTAMPAKQRSNTMRILYTVLKTDDLPGEYDEGVRDWIYLQAADAISNIGTPGPKGVFALTMAKRFSDDSLSLETRAELASLLAGMKATPGAFPAGNLVKAMLRLAAEISEREAEFATAFEDLDIGGRRKAVVDRDLMVRRVTESLSGESLLAREPMVELLSDLQAGVRATSKFAGEGGQAALSRVDQAIGEAISTITEKSSTEFAITAAVKRMASEIGAAAAPALAPVAEAVAE